MYSYQILKGKEKQSMFQIFVYYAIKVLPGMDVLWF